MKFGYTADVLEAYKAAKQGDAIPKWGSSSTFRRRNVFQNELRQVGIKRPETIAIPSVRNDAAFIATVFVVFSFLAILAGQVLPGQIGFFSEYLIGIIPIIILGIGSTAPGLLQVFIEKFSLIFPDYKERVVRHEAAHFLLAYLAGCPVTNYSIQLGRERVELIESRLQKRLIELRLDEEEVDALAIVAVAGMAAEGQQYEEVLGQTADLLDLQRILLRSKTLLSDQQQQNMTRWAVLTAGSMLRQHRKEHQAVMETMASGGTVADCVKAIESVTAV